MMENSRDGGMKKGNVGVWVFDEGANMDQVSNMSLQRCTQTKMIRLIVVLYINFPLSLGGSNNNTKNMKRRKKKKEQKCHFKNITIFSDPI